MVQLWMGDWGGTLDCHPCLIFVGFRFGMATGTVGVGMGSTNFGVKLHLVCPKVAQMYNHVCPNMVHRLNFRHCGACVRIIVWDISTQPKQCVVYSGIFRYILMLEYPKFISRRALACMVTYFFSELASASIVPACG